MFKRICATCGGDITFNFDDVVGSDPPMYRGFCEECGAVSYITQDAVARLQKLQDMVDKQNDNSALEELRDKMRPKVIYKSPQINIDKNAVAIGLAGTLLISFLTRRK